MRFGRAVDMLRGHLMNARAARYLGSFLHEVRRIMKGASRVGDTTLLRTALSSLRRCISTAVTGATKHVHISIHPRAPRLRTRAPRTAGMAAVCAACSTEVCDALRCAGHAANECLKTAISGSHRGPSSAAGSYSRLLPHPARAPPRLQRQQPQPLQRRRRPQRRSGGPCETIATAGLRRGSTVRRQSSYKSSACSRVSTTFDHIT